MAVMLTKSRLEALSDGVFAIVMTLLVIDIKVPVVQGLAMTDEILWQKLIGLQDLFISYIISFLIVGMFWMAHHAFFYHFLKHIDRKESLINIFFLMQLACVPFSAHLLGSHPRLFPSIFIYGTNIITLGLTLFVLFIIVIKDKEKLHDHVSKKTIVQAAIRILLPPVFALFGILAAFFNIQWSYFLFAFPIIFNIIPGGLDLIENTGKSLAKGWKTIGSSP